ncbi:methyltransferase family protein [Microbacterium sp.]|uniref:methyltransferase family protein n=1 Tax=Microbacterium sp. TaxID=51671 RepID=UPI0037C9FD91
MSKHPVLIPPPVWAVTAGALQLVLARRRRPTAASIASGTVIGVAAAGIAGAAVLAFLRAGTTISPEHPHRASALVTTGPFRWTRNPMYIALTGLLIAHAAVRRSWLALAPVAGFVAVIDRVQIPAEEGALRARFGRAYERYRGSVPRWVGARRRRRG